MMYLAIVSFLLYIAGFIVGIIPRSKATKIGKILSGSIMGIGLILFLVFGFKAFGDLYAGDKTWLAYLAICFSSLALGILPFYTYFKNTRPKVASVLLAILFVLGVAFLISMIALSQDVMINDAVGENSLN